jgi:peptidoglycan/LPS O-acetylase OafA/YrhL
VEHPRPSPLPHRADIQGLRALAVLLVVSTHAGVGAVPGGFVGVDVFFVVSGFLITGLLLAEARAKGSVSLVDFYARRARRILPAAALTLLATDAAVFFLLNFVRARDAVHDSLYAAGFGANFRFLARATDYFAQSDPPSPFLHYWSLSVEEQFYVVWPALLSIALFGALVVRRRRDVGRHQHRRLLLVLVALGFVSLGWSIHLTAALPSAAYFSPFTRAWELGAGAALAVAAPAFIQLPMAMRMVMGWAGLLAIAASAVLFSEATPFPGLFALVPALGTALAIGAGIGVNESRFAPHRLLALRPMCFIGDRSYAFYLWHWPILILSATYVGHELSVGVNLGLLVAALGVSCFSYALVENPIRRRARGRRAAVLVVVISFGSVLATAAVSLAAIGREQQRFEAGASTRPSLSHATGRYQARAGTEWALPEVVSAVRAARRGDPIPPGLTPRISKVRAIPPQYAVPSRCMSRNASARTTSQICRLGATGSARLIVLIGDSHAWMWLPTILEMAWRDEWAVVPLVRTGCMPNRWITSEGPAGCRRWHSWALNRARALHPQVILVAGSVGERVTPIEHAATDGIISTASALNSAGRVVVIGDPEGLGASPVDCLLAAHASMKTCTTSWPPEALSGYDRVAGRARQLGLGFVATRGFFCFDRHCPAVIGHTIAYSDNSHITAVYAAALADAFRTGFERAVGATP